jgi:hypothetical protein
MISQQSKNLINKRWPEIKDNKVLLQNVKDAVVNFVYPFGPPKNVSNNFLEKAKNRAKTIRFITGGLVVFAVLTFVNDAIQISTISAYADSITLLVIAFIFYYFYKNISRLITCYNELMCKSAQISSNGDEDKQVTQSQN